MSVTVCPGKAEFRTNRNASGRRVRIISTEQREAGLHYPQAMARMTLSLSESPRSLGREPPKLGGWVLFLSPTGCAHQENPHRPDRPHLLLLEDKTQYLCLFLSVTFSFFHMHAHTHTHTCTHVCPYLGWSPGEGDGTPLQYSCLENPMDGGAW